jgi:glycerol-3-phosphate dehydrogenase
MPIAQEVYKIVNGTSTVNDVFRGLLKRESGLEADPL